METRKRRIVYWTVQLMMEMMKIVGYLMALLKMVKVMVMVRRTRMTEH